MKESTFITEAQLNVDAPKLQIELSTSFDQLKNGPSC
jgi:hypothetical protein